MIHFYQDTYQLEYEGATVALLPKEFALVNYLYEHEGQVFTRDQLLDAVWAMEAPTDRTVDDHIYRVRRKIARWSHVVTIETIRGQGYKLVRHQRKLESNPLLSDEYFAADVHRLFSKYHGLGMGSALQLLSSHRETLGLPVDSYYDVYVHFVVGDFRWLLDTDSISVGQRIAYALFIHMMTHVDHLDSIPYMERVFEGNVDISATMHYDLQLNMIRMYVEVGRLTEAKAKLEGIRLQIINMESPSFMANYLFSEIYYAIRSGDLEEARQKLEKCEVLLNEHPIQRERGAYLVAKAIVHYAYGEIGQARLALNEGIAVTKRTAFVPHYLLNMNTILAYFKFIPVMTAMNNNINGNGMCLPVCTNSIN